MHLAERSPERHETAGPRAPARRSFQSRCSRFVHGHPVAFVAAVVALNLLFSALAFQPTPHTGGDNAAYIALGQSLLERHAYVEPYDPARPPHTQYPPVFPAILAIAMAIGLAPWVHLKLIVVAFGAAAVGFSFLWIRRRGRPLLALGVAILLALAPGVLIESHWVLSDVPFWCFTAAALWAFERMPPSARGRFAFGVAAVVAAYFTRSAGLPLAIAALGWLAWRRRWNRFAILAGVFLPLAFVWWLRARSLGGVDYVSQFLLVDPYTPALGRIGIADLVWRALANAVHYVQIHLPRLLVGRVAIWLDPPTLTLLALAAVGWVRSVRRPGVAELFLPLYLGLLLVWPAVWSGERFLLPALPLLLFYAGDAIVRVTSRALTPRDVRRAGAPVGRRAGFAAGAAAFTLIVLAAVPALRLEIRNGAACRAAYRAGDDYPCLPGEAWRDFFGVAERSSDALPDGAAVISRKPRLFYALSGRPGRMFPLTADADTFFTFADTSRTRYLVLDAVGRASEEYVQPVLLRRPAAFCAMFFTPGGTTLFGVAPNAGQIADTPPDAPMPALERCGIDYWRSEEARDVLIGPR